MRALPKIDKILSTGELQPIFAKTRELRALAELVDGFFPPDLARQVQLANFREGEAVLIAANPAAAAKLKLLGPSLIRYLAKQRWQVNSVSVRVQPSTAQGDLPMEKAAKSVHLSTDSLASLARLHAALKPSPARQALAALLARHAAHPHPAPTGPTGAPRKAGAAVPAGRKPRP